MKNERKKKAEGDMKRITLKLNNSLTNDPCAICGARCDPCGFDYFAEGTKRLVCDSCAEEYALEMVEIRRAALAYADMAEAFVKGDIRDKIRDVVNEPVEKRIMKVIDEICKDKESF